MAETYVIKEERKSEQHSEGVRDVGNEQPWDSVTLGLVDYDKDLALYSK